MHSFADIVSVCSFANRKKVAIFKAYESYSAEMFGDILAALK